MSGPFVCNIRRREQRKMETTERPSNTALYQENQKSLSELMRLREEQDKGVFAPISPATCTIQPTNDSTQYTPWKTPSTN